LRGAHFVILFVIAIGFGEGSVDVLLAEMGGEIG